MNRDKMVVVTDITIVESDRDTFMRYLYDPKYLSAPLLDSNEEYHYLYKQHQLHNNMT